MQTFIYRIGKTINPGEQKYCCLSIAIVAKDGRGDEMYFYWHYESGNDLFNNITTSHRDFSFNGLHDKMRDAGINISCRPEEVI